MERIKLLLSNFIIYGVGGIMNKIIPFLMLPIVTRMLPETAYFGMNDLSNTFVSFGATFCILGMYDTMFRMFFDNHEQEYKIRICSDACFFVVLLSAVICTVLFCFRRQIALLYFGDEAYVILTDISIASVFAHAVNQMVAGPTRIQNKRNIFLIVHLISPLVSYGIAVVLLDRQLYLYALPIGALVSCCISISVFVILNYRWFSFSRVKFNDYGKMLKFALPIVPGFLCYWVFNCTDRLMIARMLGADAAGIYAVASKMGQISQFLYTAFAGGWQYFSFVTMKDKDQIELISFIFEYLAVLSCCFCIVMAAASEFVFHLFFQGEYTKGAFIAPYLFLSPLLMMLYQTANSQLLIIKKTWPETVILGIGAMMNIITNAVLIPEMGLEGAALGTIAGYVSAIMILIIVLYRWRLIRLSSRFFQTVMLLVLYMLIWRGVFFQNQSKWFAGILILFVYLFLYRRDIQLLIQRLWKGAV